MTVADRLDSGGYLYIPDSYDSDPDCVEWVPLREDSSIRSKPSTKPADVVPALIKASSKTLGTLPAKRIIELLTRAITPDPSRGPQ
jgi:hypothetical protein